MISVVGVSTIWPASSWAQANALSWKRRGSVLVFCTVRIALGFRVERKIWIGLTVKSAAATGDAAVAARTISAMVTSVLHRVDGRPRRTSAPVLRS